MICFLHVTSAVTFVTPTVNKLFSVQQEMCSYTHILMLIEVNAFYRVGCSITIFLREKEFVIILRENVVSMCVNTHTRIHTHTHTYVYAYKQPYTYIQFLTLSLWYYNTWSLMTTQWNRSTIEESENKCCCSWLRQQLNNV